MPVVQSLGEARLTAGAPAGTLAAAWLSARAPAARARRRDHEGGALARQAMVRDSKLNSMLLPASKLRKLLMSYAVVGERGRCPFRVPNKRLW